MDDAIRTLSIEMANDKDASFIGKTEAELEILAHYAKMGRRRAAVGMICGSSIMAGLWKISKNQKRVACIFAMIDNFYKVKYSLNRCFGSWWRIWRFLRHHKHPSKLILGPFNAPNGQVTICSSSTDHTKIPNNSFVKELNEKFERSAAHADTWEQDSNAPTGFDSKTAKTISSTPRQFDNATPSSVPPIIGLDLPRKAKDSSGQDHDNLKEHQDSGTRSPFFFGAKSPSDDNSEYHDRDAPLSRDSYTQFSHESGRPRSDQEMPPILHEEDDYFFGSSAEPDAPAKSTTWDEIRRRASKQRK
ncbi:hypothetical protein CCR75_001083 [Bremia lactucae]|uniref:Uncharacterized protein n=1 Tax=Bremia lactucae TaxID=4779 RepID=A0A976FS62_BRELC|nr:hypothetical protein CCR75_001083 [Bremia lactucae]